MLPDDVSVLSTRPLSLVFLAYGRDYLVPFSFEAVRVGHGLGKGVNKFMSANDQVCPFCMVRMCAVGVDEVPVESFQNSLSFLCLRMGKLTDMVNSALTGWFWCPDCGDYSHLPTVEQYQSVVLR